MNLDDDELRATKYVRQAYDTVYTEMCRYMELYNQAEEEIEKLKKDYEQTISELYEEKERYRKLYFEEKEKNETKVTEKELKDMIIGMLE